MERDGARPCECECMDMKAHFVAPFCGIGESMTLWIGCAGCCIIDYYCLLYAIFIEVNYYRLIMTRLYSLCNFIIERSILQINCGSKHKNG